VGAAAPRHGATTRTSAISRYPITRDITTGSRGPTVPCRSLVDLADLGALKSEPAHQALLVEEHSVHVVLQRRGGQAPGFALVEADQARCRTHLEALALVQILERRIGHEEQRVPVLLHTRLEPIGRRHGVVVADGPPTFDERALSVLPAEHEPGLDDAGKY